MAEVGVLNLKVQAENIQPTTDSLKQLAGALSRVHNAVASGIKLGTVGKSIESFAKKVESAISDSVIAKIDRLGDALRGLNSINGLSNVTINIKDGAIDRVKEKVDALKDAFKGDNVANAETEARNVEAAFSDVESRIDEAIDSTKKMDEVVQNVGETAKNTTEQLEELVQMQNKIKFEKIGSGYSADSGMTSYYKATAPSGNAYFKHIPDSPYKSLAQLEQFEKEFAEWEKEIREKEGMLPKAYKNISAGLKDVQESVQQTTGEIQQNVSEMVGGMTEQLEKVTEKAGEARKEIQKLAEIEGVINNADIRNAVNAGRFKPSMYGPPLPGGANAYATKFNPTPLMEATEHATNLRGENGAQAYYNALWEEFSRTGEQSIYAVHQRLEKLKEEMWTKAPENTAEAIASTGVQNVLDSLNAKTEPVSAEKLINMDQAELMTMKMEGMKSALQADIENNRLDAQQMAERAMQIQRVNGKIDALKEAEEEATETTGSFKNAMSELKHAIDHSRIGKLVTQFSRIAKMRMIRYILKEISAGFSEGVQNVYQYSKAIGSDFYKSMDGAASSLLQMKNAIGAAVTPALQMIIPYIQQAVSGFISLVNWVNQFFALMRGQKTWTRAIPATASAFKDQENATRGAAAAMKDLLADWDELNIIQSQTGGGSGSAGATAAEDYLNMFEETSRFDNKIKEIVSFLKDNFGSILGTAIAIRAAMLGWGISKTLEGTIGTILGMATAGVTAAVVFNVTTLFDNKYLDTGNPGWLVANLLGTLIGSVFMKKILSNVLDGQYAQLAIPITFAVGAVADLITTIGRNDVSTLSKENLTLSAIGALKMGAAGAYLAHLQGSTLGASLAGGAAVALTTFGIAVGIKSVIQAVSSGYTLDTLKETALSSLAIGLGAGIFAKLAGATLLGAAGMGAAAAGLTLVTLTAAIGIAALLTTDKKDIKWGDTELTEEQIKAFASEKMFSVSVNANIEHVKTTISDVESIKRDIQTGIEASSVPLNLIKLGLATEETYKQLKTELLGEDGNGGVIGRLKQYAGEQKKLIELSYTLMPVADTNGIIDKAGTKEAIKAGQNGWAEVEKYMGDIGQRLAKALEGETINGLKHYDDKLIAELTDQLNNVQRAVTGAQISSAATGNLLTGLTGKSATGVIEQFTAYKEELRAAYEDVLKQELASYESLEAFYLARGEEGDAEKAKYYGDRAKKLVAEWKDRVDGAVKEASKPGMDIIRDSLLELLTINPEDIKVNLGGGAMDPVVSTLLNGLGVAIRNNDGTYSEDVKTGLQELLEGILKTSLNEEDFAAVKAAIDSGAVNFGDFFAKDTIDKIVSLIGTDEYYGAAIREAFANLLTNGLTEGAEEIEADNSATEAINEAVEEATTGATPNLLQGGEMPDIEYDIEIVPDESMNQSIEVPKVDTSAFDESCEGMRVEAKKTMDYINRCLSGLGVDIYRAGGGGAAGVVTYQERATGGFVKSGDLVMANENGNFEMMGKMGNQPVVANNQQIVSGISQGVSNANGEVVSGLQTVASLLQRLLNKDFVAKAVPGSSWGQHAARSADAYSRVTG